MSRTTVSDGLSFRGLAIAVLLIALSISGCVNPSTVSQEGDEPTPLPASPTPSATVDGAAVAANPDLNDLLEPSWQAYKRRFIQADGRVIDWEGDARTVSEGQAYAMLRAVLANDPETFASTLRWAERNLQRRSGEELSDRLWAWSWGKDAADNWQILDSNFASDADLDAVTALILAARRWNRSDYLDLARAKLQDLWQLSTVAAGEQRYFLPGPAIAFQPKPNLLKLNPSYLAPAAFRLFAQVDPNHDWMSLVQSSYQLLEDSAQLSEVGLPSDWIFFDTKTQAVTPVMDSMTHRTLYSFDAYRVWWRVALDAVWFQEPRASAFLQRYLEHLREVWRSQQRIPARIDSTGRPLVPYESTAQYGMLYAAFAVVDPAIAEQIHQQKLLPAYQNGIWDNDNAYYVQNLAWLGIVAPNKLTDSLLQPKP